MAREQKKLTKKEIRQDPLVKAIGRARGWLDIHGRKITVITTAVIIGVIASLFYSSIRRSATNESQLALIQARWSMQTQDSLQILEALEDIAAQFKGTPGGAEATFSLAEMALAEGRNEEALELYREFHRRYKKDFLLANAALDGQAAALEKLERYAEAAEVHDRIVAGKQGAYLAPLALYHSGRCWRLAGDTAAALERYQRIIDDYESLPIAEEAVRELAILELEG